MGNVTRNCKSCGVGMITNFPPVEEYPEGAYCLRCLRGDRPTPADRDIVDRIDELVDESLSRYDERTGYDYNVGIDKCPHCDGEWHGLPITERVREMRAYYCGCPACADQLDQYRVDEDDSPIWCPGSEFVGPWANQWQLRRIREGATSTERGSRTRGVPAVEELRRWDGFAVEISYEWPSYDASETGGVRLLNGNGEWVEIGTITPDSNPIVEELAYAPDYTLSWSSSPMGVLERRLRPIQEQLRRVLEDAGLSWTIPPNPLDPEPEPDPPTPQQRALPRPSNEPPMWAIQPNRQRRRRNR